MSRRKSEKSSRHPPAVPEQVARLRQKITDIDLVCSGSLVKRFNTCGKSICRCHQDPKYRHGPYYIWSRRDKGRLVQTVLTASQAREIKKAIRNQRRVLRLLDDWGRKTARLILAK